MKEDRSVITICEEDFFVDLSDSQLTLELTHKHWSLMGRGRTMEEAMRSLKADAASVATYFDNVANPTENVRKLKLFIFNIKNENL